MAKHQTRKFVGEFTCVECGKKFFAYRIDALTDTVKCRVARYRRLKAEASPSVVSFVKPAGGLSDERRSRKTRRRKGR